MELLIQIGFIGLLLGAGLLFGGINERRHYREIQTREAALRALLVFNERHLPPDMDIREARLICGSVVIAEDYFKRVAANLKSIFGGRLTAYESLMDRGRREAILRMKEEAQKLGATMVFNVRFETSSLSESTAGQQAWFSAEFLAYGTALIPRA
ncbi:MAG TPA: heavy metal-binding domain-containing protein [Fontimonas sp.]